MQAELNAARTVPTIRTRVGTAFAGTWMTPDKQALNVAVASMDQAPWLRAIGMNPVLVSRTEADLNRVRAALKKAVTSASPARKDITGWYADPATNQVVVTATTDEAARDLIKAAGVDPKAVRTEVSAHRPQRSAAATLDSGHHIVVDGTRDCRVGFAVTGGAVGDRGFVTAGHCGHVGSTVADSWASTPIGTVTNSIVLDRDYALVAANVNWSPSGITENINSPASVEGSDELGVGSSICRESYTTSCGVIQSRDADVYLAEYNQMIENTIMTNMCGTPGDSGAAGVSWNQGQGIVIITAGNYNDCLDGRTRGWTWLQPLKPILAEYGVALKTPESHHMSAIALYSPMTPNLCMAATPYSPSDNTWVRNLSCTGSNVSNRMWTLTDWGQLATANGGCVYPLNLATGQGTPLIVDACTKIYPAQFTLQANGTILHTVSGRCVDIWKHSKTPNSGIFIANCTGDVNQLWWSY